MAEYVKESFHWPLTLKPVTS